MGFRHRCPLIELWQRRGELYTKRWERYDAYFAEPVKPSKRSKEIQFKGEHVIAEVSGRTGTRKRGALGTTD